MSGYGWAPPCGFTREIVATDYPDSRSNGGIPLLHYARYARPEFAHGLSGGSVEVLPIFDIPFAVSSEPQMHQCGKLGASSRGARFRQAAIRFNSE
jgi:hypothetical protein